MLVNRLKKPATLLTLAAALGAFGTVGQARAGTILTSTDLNTAFGSDVLTPVAGFSELVDVTDNGGYDIGTLQNSVYKLVTPNAIDPNNGQYVYEETFTESATSNPKGHNLVGDLSAFTVDAIPVGFTAGTSKIGWNYTQAGAMGSPLTGTSSDFTINETLSTIQFVDNSGVYPVGDSLTFYYESKDAPGPGQYSVNDGDAGSALSYAPVLPVAVPVPAAASMGLVVLAGLAGFGFLRRRASAL